MMVLDRNYYSFLKFVAYDKKMEISEEQWKSEISLKNKIFETRKKKDIKEI